MELLSKENKGGGEEEEERKKRRRRGREKPEGRKPKTGWSRPSPQLLPHYVTAIEWNTGFH